MKINPKLKDDLRVFMLDKIKKEQNLVVVLSADSLSNGTRQILEKKFPDLIWQGAVYKIDKSVVAGIVIKVGSKTIDLSLSGSLLKLSNTLYEID